MNNTGNLVAINYSSANDRLELNYPVSLRKIQNDCPSWDANPWINYLQLKTGL